MRHTYAALYQLEGQIHGNAGDFEAAIERIDAAIEAAQQFGMLPAQWQLLALAAGVWDQAGDTAKATFHREAAEEIVARIQDRFSDGKLRSGYVERARATLGAT